MNKNGHPSDDVFDSDLAREMVALCEANLPDPVFADQLETRLRALHAAQAAPHSAPRRSSRHLTTLAASLALIAALFLALPPLRSFAQEIIRKIGTITITNEPNPAETRLNELLSGTPTPTPDFNQETWSYVLQEKTGAELAAAAGYPVYLPDYIPEGYEVIARQAIGSADAATSAFTLYRRVETSDFLQVRQTPSTGNSIDEWTLQAGTTPVVDVTVRGLPGVWLEDYPITVTKDVQEGWTLLGQNLLLWEEAGFTFVIASQKLPLDDLLHVAESLTPVEPPPGVVAEPEMVEEYGAMSLEDLSARVGFPVYAPTFMPGGFTIHARRAYVKDKIAVAALYYDQQYLSSPNGSPIVIYQGKNLPALAITDNDLTQRQAVTVRGHAGEWIRNVRFELYPASLGTYGVQSNVLTWEEDGVTFVIRSRRLTLDMSLRIAESLALPE